MQILCATDGSLSGRAALRVSSELADRLHAELATLDADASDPAPLLLRAARATGCDLITVGVVGASRSHGRPPDGWQRRVLRDAPCPVVLVPVGAVLPPRGCVLLASDVAELPGQAARVAGRLAVRLDAPLIITHVLSHRSAASRATGWELYSEAQDLAGQARCAAGRPLTVQQAGSSSSSSSRWQDADPLAEVAAHHEAALVVIGGRGPGRPLLPHRRGAHRLPGGTRLPIIVATAQP